MQTGRWGTQTQRAYAFDFEGGFQPAILPKLKPWIRAGYTMGSGDGNPNDNTHETFFQILPTPRPYARFPFFNMMNTEDAFGGSDSAAALEGDHFERVPLAASHERRTTSGIRAAARIQPWTFGYTGRAASGQRSLGNLYDTSVEYRANRHMTLTAYLGYAQGLAAMQQIYPAGKDGQIRLSRSAVPHVRRARSQRMTRSHTEKRSIVFGNHAIWRTKGS